MRRNWSDEEPTQLGLYKCPVPLLFAWMQRKQAIYGTAGFWKPFSRGIKGCLGICGLGINRDARRSLGVSQDLSFWGKEKHVLGLLALGLAQL